MKTTKIDKKTADIDLDAPIVKTIQQDENTINQSVEQDPFYSDESDGFEIRMGKSVLSMSSHRARSFFIKEESYTKVDFPIYLCFGKILEDIDSFLVKNNLADCVDKPREYENVNHVLLDNKDGKYAWRPLSLIHPVLYVSLVHHITSKNHWDLICDRFNQFRLNPKLQCLSLPAESMTDESDKAEKIIYWWRSVEQKSIELSLEFDYIVETDISNCYGSIYTHSIAWAIHGKEEAKKSRGNKKLLGNIVDNKFQDMNQGQTNGIPQGSVLMDFIAELVLGYADLKLSEKIGKSDIKDYHILRFRDDFKIFVNNPSDGEAIVKFITEILIELGLKVNPNKTSVSNQVIQQSIKSDKLHWNESKQFHKNLQKHLLIIHRLAARFPNSGSLVTALGDFNTRLQKYQSAKVTAGPLISIVVDIAIHSPRTYPNVTAILSKLISFLDSDEEKVNTIVKIKEKFKKIPNTGLMDVWIQRISLPLSRDIEYDEALCKVVLGSLDIDVWNSDWISSKNLKELLLPARIVNESEIDNLPVIISQSEVELFKQKAWECSQ